MKQCPQCGERYSDEHKFCSACGSPLAEVREEAPVPAPEEAPAAPETPEAPAETVDTAEAEEISPVEEPAAETPAGPEAEEKPKREKPQVGVGRRILAVLLCILLFFFLLSPALGYAARRATTKEGFQAILEDVNVAALKAAPFFDDVDDVELTLSELLSEDLGAIGLKIGESSVAKILNSSALKDYLAAQLAAVCADICRGRTSYEFDPQTLRDELMSGQTARVLEKEKVSLSATEAAEVVRLLTDYGVGDALSRDTVKSELPALNRAMNLCLSYIVIIALLVLALGLIVLIIKTNRGRVGLSLGDIGGTATAVGAVLTLTALFARLLPRAWRGICGGSELMADFSAGALFYNIRISLIVLGAGVVLAVIGRLLRGKKAE